MSIGLNGIRAAQKHGIGAFTPSALQQRVLYTRENIHLLDKLVGKDRDADCLKSIFQRCTSMYEMPFIQCKRGISPPENLDEKFIIRSIYSKKAPICVYNLGGDKVAYIGHYYGENWGDSVVLPRSGDIDSYTDLASDCPILIMLLSDNDGKESIHLTHINAEFIDIEVANIVNKLKHEKKLFPKEIIFSPRVDSRYAFAPLELKQFGENNVKVEILRRMNNFTQALVTPNGWCIYDVRSMTYPSPSYLIAGRLWKKD